MCEKGDPTTDQQRTLIDLLEHPDALNAPFDEDSSESNQRRTAWIGNQKYHAWAEPALLPESQRKPLPHDEVGVSWLTIRANMAASFHALAPEVQEDLRTTIHRNIWKGAKSNGHK